MSAPDAVVVRDGRDRRTLKETRELVAPLSGTHWVARRNATCRDDRVRVLLPLHDEDLLAALDGGNDLREAVGNEGDAVEVVDPAAVSVGTTLPKALSYVAKRLVY